MAQALSQCQHDTLSRRVHRHIGRLLNDVKTLEVNPHGMSGIGQATSCESVASQPVAELIMDGRFGNAQGRN